MRERTRLSAGNMLLLELLFAIIFFSLTLSVTLSVFGEAYALSRQAEGRTLAVAESNDVAEIIRSAVYASDMEGLFALKGLAREGDNSYTMDFGDGKYRMTVTAGLQGRLYSADIKCFDLAGSPAGEAIYELKVDHAVKEGSADGS